MKDKNPIEEIQPIAEDGQNPAGGETPVEEQSEKKGFLYFVFSPETRLGRFMRPFVRILGIIVCLFTIGFLAAYLLLYQPRLKEMNQAREDVKTMTEELNQLEGTLTAARQYLNETNTKYEQAAADLESEKDHNAMLQLLAEVNNARAALAAKDGASARIIIQNVRKLLDAYLPVIKDHSPEMAESFDSRLKLVQNEFNRDPETALADLGLISDNLLDLEKILYK